MVVDLSDRLNGGTEPLPWLLYRDCTFRGVDVPWVSGFAAYDGSTMAWAAHTATDRDREEPRLRHRLLERRAAPRDVATLLDSDYTVADLEALGDATGLPFRRAAESCAAWVRIGCEPEVSELAALARSRAMPAPAGGVHAVDELMARFPPGERPTYTEAALVLAAAGNVRVADSLLSMGVRTVAAATAVL